MWISVQLRDRNEIGEQAALEEEAQRVLPLDVPPSLGEKHFGGNPDYNALDTWQQIQADFCHFYKFGYRIAQHLTGCYFYRNYTWSENPIFFFFRDNKYKGQT